MMVNNILITFNGATNLWDRITGTGRSVVTTSSYIRFVGHCFV